MKKIFLLLIVSCIFISCSSYKFSLNEIVTPYISEYGAIKEISVNKCNFSDSYNYMISNDDYYVNINISKTLFWYHLDTEYISIGNTSTFKSDILFIPYVCTTKRKNND